jgi:hypothetical protein
MASADFDSPQALKESHKEYLALALKSFQSQAFGDSTIDFLEKIEKEIDSKYK